MSSFVVSARARSVVSSAEAELNDALVALAADGGGRKHMSCSTAGHARLVLGGDSPVMTDCDMMLSVGSARVRRVISSAVDLNDTPAALAADGDGRKQISSSTTGHVSVTAGHVRLILGVEGRR